MMQQRSKTIRIYCIIFICLSFVSCSTGQVQQNSSNPASKTVLSIISSVKITQVLRELTNKSEISNMSPSIQATTYNQYLSILYILTCQQGDKK